MEVEPVIDAFMKDMLSLLVFQPDADNNNLPAIETTLDKGQGKLVIITGDNASGKSLVRRLVHSKLHKKKTELIHISQQGRTTEGLHRAFIYGAEDWESTGAISANTLQKSLKTSRSRGEKHCLFWDEPDIGLSDNYAAGLGVAIRNFIADPPALLQMAFLVTHNKALVKQLMPLKPWNLRLGGCPSLQEWLDAEIVPASLDELYEKSHDRFRRIAKFEKRK
jgi:energy-coupling factor transporter ATP-binding protein EcfA2